MAETAMQGSDPTNRLFGREMLSRKEALDRCMSPMPRRKQDASVRLQPDRLVRLGNGAGTTLLYRPSTPYLNRQLREEYSVDHYTQIGRQMADFGQLQECGIAAFTNEGSLASYISDSDDFYKTETEAASIVRHRRLGLWIVTIYGHNRQLGAATQNLTKNGHPDRGLMLRGHVHFDPSFSDFLHMQAIENTGEKPPEWSRARSMARMFELGLRDGKNHSLREIADFYGVHEDQVWRSLNYVQLPQEVQTLVEGGLLPYSGAVELRRLQEVYAEQDLIGLAREAASKNWSSKQFAAEVSKRVTVRSLPAEFQAFVNSDNIKPKQAELVLDMYNAGASDAELRQFLTWITRKDDPPTLNEIRARVAARRATSRSTQGDIFQGGYDDDATAVAERDRLAISTQRADVTKTIGVINAAITTLKDLIENGAYVDLADDKPITRAVADLNGTLLNGIDGLVGVVGAERYQTLIDLLQNLDTHGLPVDIQVELTNVITGFDELLLAEATASSAEQQARITAARERIRQIGAAHHEELTIF